MLLPLDMLMPSSILLLPLMLIRRRFRYADAAIADLICRDDDADATYDIFAIRAARRCVTLIRDFTP